MHPDGTFIVAGLSARRGSITAHAIPTGTVSWRRDKVAECGFFDLDRSGSVLSFARGRTTIERADAHSGATIDVLPQTCRYLSGPAHYTLLDDPSQSTYVIAQREHTVSVPKLSFALLGAAFSSRTACITESGGPVRCVDCTTGAELWRYTPPTDSHILDLHYNALDRFFYGVLWHYERGEFRFLVRFDSGTGKATRVRDLDSWVEVFSEATQQLVTSSGEVIELSSGELLGKLGFPQKEYPDPSC
jgi:hypothetical protein